MAWRPLVKKLAVVAILSAGVAVAGKFAMKKMDGHAAHVPADASTEVHSSAPNPSGLLGPVARVLHAWKEMRVRLEEFQTVDEENSKLRDDNGRMRVTIAKLESNCTAEITRNYTRSLSDKLDDETGQAVGRLLETIHYRPPNHLMPDQLLVLAGSYFKSKDFERAAVIMTDLVGREMMKEFRTPSNYLLAGVAWYHLDHLKQADFFFGKVLETEVVEDHLKYHAQARLWRALLSKRLGIEQDSQTWLNELVSNHPHSPEAGWVNGMSETARALANQKAVPADQDASEPASKEGGGHHDDP